MTQKELDVTMESNKVASREGGNVGDPEKEGDVRSDLIDEILTQIPTEKILWKAS